MTNVDIGAIPQDCWNLIFEKLDSETLKSIAKTSKLFEEIFKEYEKTHPYWEREQREYETDSESDYPIDYSDYKDRESYFDGRYHRRWDGYVSSDQCEDFYDWCEANGMSPPSSWLCWHWFESSVGAHS